ncbi:MAG: hypothetical protein K2G21_06775, partial [Muribaculaceae bacterium]|nr:hypothetical protein [Muribaculaceae bacterium]
ALTVGQNLRDEFKTNYNHIFMKKVLLSFAVAATAFDAVALDILYKDSISQSFFVSLSQTPCFVFNFLSPVLL